MDAGFALALRLLSLDEAMRCRASASRYIHLVSAAEISVKTQAIQHLLVSCPNLHTIIMTPDVCYTVKIARVGEEILPSRASASHPPLAWGIYYGRYWTLEQVDCIGPGKDENKSRDG